jgi:hypothetical protein
MSFSNREIEKAILKSQHCQRNWDLSRQLPPEDMEVLITAVSSCPSKQNVAYYRAHFITNRQMIEKIHDLTDGFTVTYEPHTTTTNTQTLANLVIVFEPLTLNPENLKTQIRNEEIKEFAETSGSPSEMTRNLLLRDMHMAVGVAAGYVNLAASLMGYETGCCACFHPSGVQAVLNCENPPALMMGIGYKDPDRGRRVHHKESSFLFPTKPKEKISVNIIS